MERGLALKKGKMWVVEGKPTHKIIIFKYDKINAVCIVHGIFNMK